MTQEKDTNGKLLPDVTRLTKFGKFLRNTSMDELPSLWNAMLYDNLWGLIRAVFPSSNWIKDRYSFEKNRYLPYYYVKRLYELVFQRMAT
jgi:hypothetical protein